MKKLTRFTPLRTKRTAHEDEEEEGGVIAAIKLLPLPASPAAPPSRRCAAASAAAAAAALVLLLLVAAAARRRLSLPWAAAAAPCQGLQEAATAVPAQAGFFRGLAPGRSSSSAVPHLSSLWGSTQGGACSAAAAAHAELLRHQTRHFVQDGFYSPKPPVQLSAFEDDASGAATPNVAAACRSDAPPSTPLPRLLVAAELRSKGRPLEAAQGATLVTQLSLERLPMLERQCRAWPHQLAAAVYIPLLHGRVASADDTRLNGTSLDAALVPLLRMHAAMEAAGGSACSLDLQVLTEPHCSALSAALYPTNAARNAALRLSRTEVVLLMDVDFVPSASILGPSSYPDPRHHHLTTLLALLQKQPPMALVLPAFETATAMAPGRGKSMQADAELAAKVARGGKQELLRQLDAGAVQPFHGGIHAKGHGPTDFRKWAFATTPYNATYHHGFEPYVLAHRSAVPWYDERFRGYFVNKVVHLSHMASLGTRFLVHPTAFVVHQPHPPSSAKRLAAASGLQDQNNQLYMQALQQMRERTYLPFVADAQLCYTSKLWGSGR